MQRSLGTVPLMFLALAAAGCRTSEPPAVTERREQPRSNSAPVSAAGPARADVVRPAAGPQLSYADVVERVTPAVVTIRSARRVRPARQFPFFDDPTFRELFGNRQAPSGGQPRVARGLGSGVIVRNDGHVLTNHHVIDGAEEINVELSNRRSVRATLVGSDPPSDLAVLKMDVRDLTVLPLGDSDRVRVGDIALAIGNPLGIGQTVTAGIISAKGRATGVSDGSFEDFLQTDAPINQGNSGGALINPNGELIGINSQIVSPSGGNIGIGFAIPSNMAKDVMNQLIQTGRVRRAQLGISVAPMTEEAMRQFNISATQGILVGSVAPGSAASRAGLREGDVITALNGQAVTDGNTFRNRIASTGPGSEVTLTFSRDGREQQARVRLGEYSPER